MLNRLIVLFTLIILTSCGDATAASKAQIFETLLTSQRAGGVTLSGGLASFYVPGTETYKAIYSDRNKTIPAANPYTLSADGTAQVYGDGLYDVAVANSAGVLKYLWEDVQLTDYGTPADSTGILIPEADGTYSSKATIYEANTSPDAVGKTIIISAPIVMTANLTLATDRAWKFEKGALVTTTGYTLNANSAPVEIGNYQAFTGTGSVTNLKVSNPIWFGAIGGDATADLAGFQKAQAASDSIRVVKTSSPYIVNTLAPSTGKHFYGDGGYPQINTSTRAFYIVAAQNKVTIEGLHISAVTPASGKGIEMGGAPGSTNVIIRDNRFSNLANGVDINGSPISPSSQHTIENNLFEDCTIPVSLLGITRSNVFKNTMRDLTAKMLRGIAMQHGTHNDITHNTIIGSQSTTVTGIFVFTTGTTATSIPISDNLIANNYISNIKEEGLSLDTTTSAFKHGGTATSGSITTVVQSGAGWTTNAYVGYYAVIVDGTGKGGYRVITANTTDTLTVAQYFQVAPDNTSKFVIMSPPMRNRIVNNIVRQTLREGIYIWSSGIGNVISGNTVDGCGSASIPAVSLLGIGYNGSTERGPVFHNVVQNNTINNNSFAGIRVGIYSDVLHASTHQLQGNIVTGNIVTGYGVGVLVEYTENTLVSGNTFVGSSSGVKLTASTRNSNNRVVDNITSACFKPYEINQTQGYVEFDVSAMPTTGTFAIGTFARNINPTLTGTGGYVTANQKYTILGWSRITTGTGNVLNTDWVEVRSLTGA